MFAEEPVDGVFDVGEGAEDAAFQAPSGEGGEESFDGVEPRACGWREVEGPAWVPCQPVADGLVFVGYTNGPSF